ncbi:MAG: deoxycytidylate deaminase [Chthonomonadales bacterium]
MSESEPQAPDIPVLRGGRARPSWDEYFMEIARVVSTRATCNRRHVGAVVVRDRRILTTGYNGAPHGLPHCTEVGCKMQDGHCIRTLHAEQNAIVQGALNGVSLRGATLYVTCQPCNNCAKMIINAGIVKVVFDGDYPDEFAMELFEEAGIELIRLRSALHGTREKLL